MLNVFFDGSCGPKNPGGTAAWGFVVKDESGDSIHTASGRAGRGVNFTNNVAEYEALYQSMVWIEANYPDADVVFHGDSWMVISQMNGESQAKKGMYIPYFEKTMKFAYKKVADGKWTFKWIARAFNSEADELSQYHRS